MSHRKAPPVKHDDPGMAGQRSRNEGGSLRQKRADTELTTLREQYHIDTSRRGDTRLDTLRKEFDTQNLSDIIQHLRDEQ